MLRELKVVEQRYQAVLRVLDGIPVTEVAEWFGVARLTVHRWVARYRDSGIEGLADRSHAPKSHPWRISAEVEAVICDLRGSQLAGFDPREATVTGALIDAVQAMTIAAALGFEVR